MSHTFVVHHDNECTELGSTTFHYNSDFSGEVVILQKGNRRQDPPTKITVPVKNILAFVARCYVATEKMHAIEMASTEELLKGSK